MVAIGNYSAELLCDHVCQHEQYMQQRHLLRVLQFTSANAELTLLKSKTTAVD